MFKAIWKRKTPRNWGLTITINGLLATYKSWDDPPSAKARPPTSDSISPEPCWWCDRSRSLRPLHDLPWRFSSDMGKRCQKLRKSLVNGLMLNILCGTPPKNGDLEKWGVTFSEFLQVMFIFQKISKCEHCMKYYFPPKRNGSSSNVIHFTHGHLLVSDSFRGVFKTFLPQIPKKPMTAHLFFKMRTPFWTPCPMQTEASGSSWLSQPEGRQGLVASHAQHLAATKKLYI